MLKILTNHLFFIFGSYNIPRKEPFEKQEE
jgi:hypothetical protein